MFISREEQFHRNTVEAMHYSARPAKLTNNGQHEPGVVVRSGNFIKVVLPVTEALRLANEIADAVAAHKQKVSA